MPETLRDKTGELPVKVLLIRPPLEFRRGWDVAAHAEIPLALLSIGACLERTGHQVRLLDGAVQREPSALEFGPDGVLRVGATWDEMARIIRQSAPDLVGINSTFYTQMPPALQAARLARKLLPNIPIIVGGAPVTVRPEDYLAEPAVTAAALGEAEETAPRLVEALVSGGDLSSIPGIVWRRGKDMQVNPRAGFLEDLDALPDPAYHLLDLPAYLRTAGKDAQGRWRWQERRVLTVQTSRGCPFHCTFCTVHALMGRRYRYQSPERVLGHVRRVATELDIRHIYFIDDNLAQNTERFLAIIAGLEAMNREGMPITWETPMGMRTDKLTFGVLEKAKAAGCRSIFLTVESGSQRVLDDVIHKGLRLESVVRAADACKRLGLKARAGFIMGLPGETLADMQMTVDFARMLKRRYGVRGHLSLATPLYATELNRISAERGYLRQEITPDNVARSFTQGGMIETEDWTIPQLRAMRDAFNRQGSWLRRAVQRIRRSLSGGEG